MIILNRKRLAIILSCMIIAVFAFTFQVADQNKTVQTVTLPVSNKVIVLDAGHGKPDEGAVGIYGATEEALNLKIALKLQNLVEQSGGIVYLTRSDENGIYLADSPTLRQKKVSDIKNRVALGNQEDVDAFISIHLNKYPTQIYSGWQTFFQNDNEKSKYLASCIQDGLNASISTPNTRVPLPLKGIYIMDHVENTTVTVECGFLSNPEEAKKLEDGEYQDKLACGIYKGIQEYFK